MTNENRVPAGSPEGGQWAAGSRPESSTSLLEDYLPPMDDSDYLPPMNGDEPAKPSESVEPEFEMTSPVAGEDPFAEGVDLDALSKKSVQIRYAASEYVDPETGHALAYSGLAPRDENPLALQEGFGGQQLTKLRDINGVSQFMRENNVTLSKVEAVYLRDGDDGIYRYAAVNKETGELIGMAKASPQPEVYDDDPDDVATYKRQMGIKESKAMRSISPEAQIVYARAHRSPTNGTYTPSPAMAERLARLGYRETEEIDAAYRTGANSMTAPDVEPERAVALSAAIDETVGAKGGGLSDRILDDPQTDPRLKDALLKAPVDRIEELTAKNRTTNAGCTPWKRTGMPVSRYVSLGDKEFGSRLADGAKAGLSVRDVSNNDYPVSDLGALKEAGVKVPALSYERGWRQGNTEGYEASTLTQYSHDEVTATGATPRQFETYKGEGVQPQDMPAYVRAGVNDPDEVRRWQAVTRNVIFGKSTDAIKPGVKAVDAKRWGQHIRTADDVDAIARLKAHGVTKPSDLEGLGWNSDRFTRIAGRYDSRLTGVADELDAERNAG